MDIQITSFQNPLVKRIRSLKYKKYRIREGCFWAEGIRSVLEAMETSWEIEYLIWSPEMLRSDLAREAIKAAAARTVTVSKPVFERLTMSELPQGMGAMIRTPNRNLSQLPVTSDAFFVALENPQDRGNVGAVVRTIDCAGGQGVILLGQSVDPFDPAAIRASMGAIFSTPIVRCTPQEFHEWNKENRLQLVGTSAHAKTGFRQANYSRPLVLLFGNERSGLSEDLQAAANLLVQIPIQGRSSSLNLSAAVAVLAYQIQGAK